MPLSQMQALHFLILLRVTSLKCAAADFKLSARGSHAELIVTGLDFFGGLLVILEGLKEI